jgi:hypothetical protein
MSALNTLTKIVFFIIVIAAPIQWVSILTIGSLSFKYIDLAIVPILICFLFKSFRRTFINFYKFNNILVFAFVYLMALNFIYTSLNSDNQDLGFSYIFKNLFYLIYFLVFGPVVYYRLKNPKLYKEITISNGLCIIFFLFVVEVTFLSMGRNFMAELLSNFLKGNSAAIRYDLFYKLFNAHGGTVSVSSDSDYQTNLRNTLLGAFIYINFTSLYALKFCKSILLKLINVFNILFGTFLVFASTSRSNMIALVIGYMVFYALSIYSGTFRFKLSSVFITMILAFLFVLFLPSLQSTFQNSTSMISDRLAQLDQDARWNLDGEALVYFASNPLNGKGAGAVLSDGHRVHNFILGAAYQTGVLGFILSIIFYFGTLAKLVTSAKYIAGKKPLFWFASLMCLPLLRAMTSGNNGTLSIIEWFCLAFFFAVCMQEKENYEAANLENYYDSQNLKTKTLAGNL